MLRLLWERERFVEYRYMSNWSPHAFSTCSDNNALITDTQSHNGPNGHATHKLDVKEQEMKQKRMNQKKKMKNTSEKKGNGK